VNIEKKVNLVLSPLKSGRSLWGIKNGKLLLSHRYNQLPLLYSYSGGVSGAGRKRLADANIQLYTNYLILFSFFYFYLVVLLS
jgi:hypothetical protein